MEITSTNLRRPFNLSENPCMIPLNSPPAKPPAPSLLHRKTTSTIQSPPTSILHALSPLLQLIHLSLHILNLLTSPNLKTVRITIAPESMASDGSGAATETGQNSTPPNANPATSMPPPEQGLKCPRCDSPNTKFCYYNNYSLSQPRHFCKTCRRYWTKGGALRNVPVGGGCRKNKKSKSSALSRLSLVPTDPMVGNFSDPGVGLQNLLSAPSQLVVAASDFQLGVLPFSRLHSPTSYSMSPTNKYISAGEIPSHGSAFSPPNISPSGLGYPASSTGAYGKMAGNGSSHGVGTGSIASSIESLSFINQDLHFKLQQQRMAMLFQGDAKEAAGVAAPVAEGHMQALSPDFGESSGLQKTWFAENSFVVPAGASTGTGTTRIGSDDGINNTGNNTNNSNYWSGAGSSGWNDMPQFTAMP